MTDKEACEQISKIIDAFLYMRKTRVIDKKSPDKPQLDKYIRALKHAYAKLLPDSEKGKSPMQDPLPGQLDIEDYIKEIS